MSEVQAITEEQELSTPDLNDNAPAEVMELVGDADDRSSSLSDIEDRVMADVNETHGNSEKSEDDDTEAETERLEVSPQKARKQKVITLKPMQTEPSKSTMSIEQQGLAEEGQLVYAEYHTQKLMRAEPTSSISSLGDSVTSGSRHSPQTSSPNKRKRSTLESVESDEDATTASLKKVSKNLAEHLKSSPSANDLDTLSRNALHHRKSPSNAPALSLPRDQKSASASESQAVSAQRSSRASHDHGRANGNFEADTNRNNGVQAPDDENATVDGNDETLSNDEDAENVDADVENDVDVTLRNDDEGEIPGI